MFVGEEKARGMDGRMDGDSGVEKSRSLNEFDNSNDWLKNGGVMLGWSQM